MSGGEVTIRARRCGRTAERKVLAALQAWEDMSAPPTTDLAAASADMTVFAAWDVLSSLKRQGLVYSTLERIDGRPQRVWRIVHKRKGAA